MRHTIVSLAVLKVTYEDLGKDILDVYLPFVLSLVADRGYAPIDHTEVDALSRLFFERYGLRVPRLSIQAILTRAVKRGYVRQVDHRFLPRRERIEKLDFTHGSALQQARIDSLLDRLIGYAKSEFAQVLTADEAERALLQYLADQDVEIVVSAATLSVLPRLEQSKSGRYIAGRFIQWCYENDYGLFRAVADVAVGHMLASTILYDDFRRFVGKFKRSTVYLDAPLLLHLLGADGPEYQVATRELVEVLRKQGARTAYFDTILDEALTILRVCQDRVEKRDIDRNAGTAVRYFRQAGKSRLDIERLINAAESILRSEGVDLVDTPDPNDYRRYRIKDDVLEKTIIETYWGPGAVADDEQARRISRDARTLGYVYMLREDREPRSLADARHLFVTENTGLVRADRKFSRSALHYHHDVSAAQTDVLVCTVAWLQSPQDAQGLNSKRLIADVHAALAPDAILVEKYVAAVESLREDERITRDEAIVLRGSMIATQMLQASSLNDPDRFVPRMAEDILEAIKRDERAKGQEALATEQGEHVKTQRRLAEEREETEAARARVVRMRSRVRLVASMLARGAGYLLLAVAAVLYVVGVASGYASGTSSVFKILAVGTYQVLAFVGTVFGVTVVRMRDKLTNRLVAGLESLLLGEEAQE
jgi:hypothetical protein